jgi:Phage integrase family
MATPPEETTPRPRRTRNPNYRSTIYQTKDGYWHGRVTIGTRDDGRPDRRHVGGKTRSEVAKKVRALEREWDRGTLRKTGERRTVGRWLTYWVENIAAPPHVAENTHNGLREARLHDARHTAATVLLVMRQPTPTVMSLMGWSSESMAARYQHVTDAMRSQVAGQLGELIWDSAASADQALVTVRYDSLAAVLAVAEKCVTSRHTGAHSIPGVLAALAELRAARPAAPSPETANETKTETRRLTEE